MEKAFGPEAVSHEEGDGLFPPDLEALAKLDGALEPVPIVELLRIDGAMHPLKAKGDIRVSFTEVRFHLFRKRKGDDLRRAKEDLPVKPEEGHQRRPKGRGERAGSAARGRQGAEKSPPPGPKGPAVGLVDIRLQRMSHLKQELAPRAAVRFDRLPGKGELPEPAREARSLQKLHAKAVLPAALGSRLQAQDRHPVPPPAKGKGYPVEVPLGSTPSRIPDIDRQGDLHERARNLEGFFCAKTTVAGGRPSYPFLVISFKSSSNSS
jgi:hypothetical protein